MPSGNHAVASIIRPSPNEWGLGQSEKIIFSL